MRKMNKIEVAEASTNFNHIAAGRPLRELFHQLRRLGATHETRDPATRDDATFLVGVAANADATMRIVHFGLGAIGNLVARCSLDLQDGTVSAESIENLGFLMAELGDLASECLRITSECKATAACGAKGGTDA